MFSNVKSDLQSRFLRYTVIDTMSDDKLVEKQHPSTKNQLDLINLLKKELEELNIKDITVGKEDRKSVV